MTSTCSSFSLNNHFIFFYITVTSYYTAHIVKKPTHLLHQKIERVHEERVTLFQVDSSFSAHIHVICKIYGR